jgi:AcrR family transcriptional regulator
VFGRLGYRGGSMREIADRVGLTDAGVMHHFGTKHQLLIAVLEHREAISRQGRPRQQGLDLLEDLRQLVAHNATMPGLVQLFVTVSAEATDPDHPAHEFFVARYEEVTRYFADQLATARDAGQVRADADLAAAAQQLIAVMDGLQVQYLLTKVDMVAAFDQFLEGFRRTLGIRAVSRPRRNTKRSKDHAPAPSAE